MSVLNEVNDTVLQCQKIVSPNDLYPTLKLATATYDHAVLGDNAGPFQIPFSVSIPEGAFVLNVMFNILTVPVGPTLFYAELGAPSVWWNISSPIPIGVPWNQGNVPYEFSINTKTTSASDSILMQFSGTPTSGKFTLTFYFV